MPAAKQFCLVTAVLLGVGASVGSAAPLLTFETNTTPVGSNYAPANCVAIWIETGDGTFVKTIGRWCSDLRATHLVAWRAKAGPADADAISGATRLDHSDRLSKTWDLTDKLGATVPDGPFVVRIETTDGNASTAAENWQGSFPFTTGLAPDVTTPTDPHYPNASVKFDPTALECNNNVVDPGETCDPPGTCPVDCEPSGDACAPNVMLGTAAACTAACTVVPITTCIDGDGCCADGCDRTTDSDCQPEEVGGGCEAGGDGGSPLAFAALGALALATRFRAGRASRARRSPTR
jgi:hypothetical protein